MKNKKFQEWHEWVKNEVGKYQDVGSRMAVIEGFFSARHGERFTGNQVSQILALGYPEK